MKEFIRQLAEKRDLSKDEAEEAMKEIMSGNASDAQIAAFLVALRLKGETPEEIASFCTIMREFAENIHPDVGDKILVDTCGTGGDKIKTFNISTAAMFVVAGCGIPIAKHGNRSVTSKCGSADVLEALGVKIDRPPGDVKRCIEEIGIGFMFAPVFHKAMKYVMPARTQIGIRTVFNILGPLTNPANAKGQVVGVYDENLTEKLATVLKLVGLERAMVVHGMDGMDEISTIGRTKISELRDGKVNTYFIKPENFKLKKANAQDISGGNAEENARIIRDILEGAEQEAMRDIVLLNAAAGIMVGGLADDLDYGLELAVESIDSGASHKKLNQLVGFY